MGSFLMALVCPPSYVAAMMIVVLIATVRTAVVVAVCRQSVAAPDRAGTATSWAGHPASNSSARGIRARDHTPNVAPASSSSGRPGLSEITPDADLWGAAPAYDDCSAGAGNMLVGACSPRPAKLQPADNRLMELVSRRCLARRRPMMTDDIVRIIPLGNQESLASDHRRSESAWRADEERLRSVVLKAPIMLFALDHAGTFNLVTGGEPALLDHTSEELINRSIYEVCADRPEILESYRRALAGEAHTLSCEFRDLTVETHWLPEFDGAGNVETVIGVTVNVTERATAQRAA